jgi:hypothetical protein
LCSDSNNVIDTFQINNLMRIEELLEKIAAPTASQCSVGKSRLSNVRYSQCVSRGLLKHDSDHTAGTGTQGKKGSGVRLKGKKMKSTIHGGPVKDYDGK